MLRKASPDMTMVQNKRGARSGGHITDIHAYYLGIMHKMKFEIVVVGPAREVRRKCASRAWTRQLICVKRS